MSQEDIVSATVEEYALMGDIVADGFADDPVNLWALSNIGVMRGVFTTMARYLYLPRGFGYRTAAGDAASLWLPPGVKKQLGLVASLKMARAIIGNGGLPRLRNALAVDSLMSAKRPVEPHYYLFAIAARSDRRGKGLGGQLMQAALERVDSEHMPAYLENSKEQNIGFYRHFGFEIVEQIRPGKDGPPLWLMWRAPR